MVEINSDFSLEHVTSISRHVCGLDVCLYRVLRIFSGFIPNSVKVTIGYTLSFCIREHSQKRYTYAYDICQDSDTLTLEAR